MLNLYKNRLLRLVLWAQKIIRIDLIYIAKNSFWMFINSGISGASGLIIMILLARNFDKGDVGNFQLFLTIFSIISVISIPGINTAVFQMVANGHEEVYKKGVKLSFKWSLIGIPTLILIAIFHLLKNNYQAGVIMLLAAPFFPFYFAPNTWAQFLQAKTKFKLYATYDNIQQIVMLTLIAFFVLILKVNIFIFTIVYVGTISTANIIFYLKTRPKSTNDALLSDDSWKKYGYFLTKINLVGNVLGNIDSLAVGWFLGPEKLAIYAIALKSVKGIQGILKNIISVLAPKISQKNTLNLRKYIIIFSILFPLSIILAIFTPTIINLAYTTQYSSSGPIAAVLLLFLPLWVITNLLENHVTLYLKDKKITTLLAFLPPIFFLIIAIPLAIYFELIGLALSYGLAIIFRIVLIMLFISPKQPKMPT